jgi:PIN domain
VTVVLDSTVLLSDPLLGGVPWTILAQAARRGVRLCITEVVLQESIAGYSRRMDEAVVVLERWRSKHAGALGVQPLVAEFAQQLSEHAASYAEQLKSVLDAIPVEVLPIPDVDHQVLIERATSRVPPCDSEGDGYRDTLNWFSILALAEDGDSSVIWVSADSDFAGEDEDVLHPELQAELNERDLQGRITLIRSVRDAALVVASQFGNAEEDLHNIRDRLIKDALTNYVRTELLADSGSVEVSAASLALPLGAEPPVLSALGDITDTEIEAKAALEGEEAAVEVGFTCNTTILADTSEITKPLRFTALLTVDQYDSPTGGEITSIRALEGDPGFAALAADANGDQMVRRPDYLRKANSDEKVWVLKENGNIVFTKPYVEHTLLSKKEYGQGTSGFVTELHTGLLGDITGVDVRLADGTFVRDVPVDYFKA